MSDRARLSRILDLCRALEPELTVSVDDEYPRTIEFRHDLKAFTLRVERELAKQERAAESAWRLQCARTRSRTAQEADDE